jgi:hypothetical protein
MSAIDPLVRIARTAFPYWLIVAVFVSVLSAFIAKRSNQASFLAAAVGQFGATCAFLFMVLGVYVQLSGNAMSFVELLPSSLLVAMGFSATFLVFARSKTDVRLGMVVVGIAFFSVVLGIFLAFVLSVFPKLIAFQWHLLDRL